MGCDAFWHFGGIIRWWGIFPGGMYGGFRGLNYLRRIVPGVLGKNFPEGII